MIEQFTDEYRWLSNFAPCKIVLDGIEYASTEHAYMSAKSEDPAWKEYCRTEPSAGKVKTKSYQVKLIDNWDLYLKYVTMYRILEQKFTLPHYRELLLATGDQYIEEGNMHGDMFWGVCMKTTLGKNILGHMIMSIRSKLQQGLL